MKSHYAFPSGKTQPGSRAYYPKKTESAKERRGNRLRLNGPLWREKGREWLFKEIIPPSTLGYFLEGTPGEQ